MFREYRDQGLTRPKVLMILPFRDSARRAVDTFIQLLNPTDQGFVANKNRFQKEYSLPEEEEPRKGYKPGLLGLSDLDSSIIILSLLQL